MAMMTRGNRIEPETLAKETATRWTQLDAELRMICRSLASPKGWTPEAVTTFVRLPGDAEYRQAIGTLCRRLALEYRLEASVRRDGDEWRVRFARPVVAGQATTVRELARAQSARSGVRAAIAQAYAAARRLSGPKARQRVDAV
jgi:hypothetical protein